MFDDESPYQMVTKPDRTECLDSQVSTPKTSGAQHSATVYDYDNNIVYICGGKIGTHARARNK